MEKRIADYSVSNIFSEDPLILLELLKKEYDIPIPETLDTVEDLKKAGQLLGQLSNAYSYMAQLSAYAKLQIRKAKRENLGKSQVDDAIDRKAVIDTFADTLNLRYKAVSRMLTIKQQINEELKMTDGKSGSRY